MSEINTKWTTFPVCPHCGIENQDWWDGIGIKEDGDSWEVECDWCQKNHIVTLSVSYSFNTKAADAYTDGCCNEDDCDICGDPNNSGNL